MIDCVGKTINLITASSVFSNIQESMHNCLDEHSMLEQPLHVESPVSDLLMTYFQGEINKIASRYQKFIVTIANSEKGFIVKGTKNGLSVAFQEMKTLIDKICSGNHVISRPGIDRYFRSKKGIAAVKAVETTYKVICADPRRIVRPEVSEQTSSPISTATKELYMTTFPGGTTVKVLVGDITQQTVDAIVNAANSQLKHNGGLARAIIEAGK